jgi:hypothetical protein
LDSSFVIKKIARSPIDIKQLIRYEANVSTSGAFSLDPKQYNEIEKNGLKIELANMEMAKGSSPDEALRSVMGLTKEEYEQAEKILEKDIYQMSSLFQSKQPILTSR